MAITLFSTTTLIANTDPVEFTNIPQTGKDLLLVVSARNTSVSSQMTVAFNGTSTTTNWTRRHIASTNGSTVATNTGTDSNTTSAINPSDHTANFFSNTQFYISNYASTTLTKMMQAEATAVNDSVTVTELRMANYRWNDTSAISSISLTANSGDFLTLSSFSLYIIS